MDGRGRCLDNVFVERLWRTVKYEEISLKDYADFWRVCDSVAKYQQKCWPHLLRDLKEVDAKAADEEWNGFSKKLKRICADGIRLKLARDDWGEAVFDSRVAALNGRLLDLGAAEWIHPDARRLAKRLVTYWDSLLRFVEHRAVPADNHRAERGNPPGRADAQGQLRQRQRSRHAQRADEYLPHLETTRRGRADRHRTRPAGLHDKRQTPPAANQADFGSLMGYGTTTSADESPLVPSAI